MGMDSTLLTGDDGLDSTIPMVGAMPGYDTPAWNGPKSKMPSVGTLSLMTMIMGGINSAVGGYYQAQAQQYQQKSAAVSSQYESDMAAINARSSEYQAESDIKSGQSQVFNYTMAAGQQKSAAVANMASRGLRAGIGTTADVAGSMDIVKDVNVYNINSNAVREASAARVQSTNYQNQSNMDAVSANNDNRSAGSISPFAAGSTSLLTSASLIGGNWNTSQRMKMYVGNGGFVPGSQGGFN